MIVALIMLALAALGVVALAVGIILGLIAQAKIEHACLVDARVAQAVTL